MGYIDGTDHCLPKTVRNSDDVNPDYILWLKHDQLVLSWIITSLSENVLSQVIGLKTAYEVWSSLKRSYASHSRSRIIHLKGQLQDLKKGNKTADEYFQHGLNGDPIYTSDAWRASWSTLDSRT
ncbi:hypothetical protein EJ110_NYTH10034 [Nymphaea thermarum]|nr:hypothetical protein EJ110_NYTH10034 [Nymphaea thermarum]